MHTFGLIALGLTGFLFAFLLIRDERAKKKQAGE